MMGDDFSLYYSDLSEQYRKNLKHGHWEKWAEVISKIRELALDAELIDGDAPRFHTKAQEQAAVIEDLFLQLKPWRKGPFLVGDVLIDSEWQCYLKWQRIAHLIDWTDKNVLDIGSGNGYFALRIALAGANHVTALDPTDLFLAQYDGLMATLADNNKPNCSFIAAPLERFVTDTAEYPFNCALSMGVLYHRRDPQAHLREIKQCIGSEGEVIIETLIQQEEPLIIPLDGRYCGMPNVHALPSIELVQEWLANAGYKDIIVEDSTFTTIEEQRATKWSGSHSLEARLSSDLSRTVEGLPAPLRVVIKAITT